MDYIHLKKIDGAAQKLAQQIVEYTACDGRRALVAVEGSAVGLW